MYLVPYFQYVTGAGSNPKWNEVFLFTVSDDVCEIDMKLMDEDGFTQDDFLGRAMWVYFSFKATLLIVNACIYIP